MDHLKSLDTDDPSQHGWTFHTERAGVRIYSKRLPGESIPTFRGDGWIDGNWSLEDIAAVIRTLGARQICKSHKMGSTLLRLLCSRLVIKDEKLTLLLILLTSSLLQGMNEWTLDTQ